MLAPAFVVDWANRVRQPFNVNALAQAGARAALRDHEHLERTRRLNREELAFYVRYCESAGLAYVSSVTNFLLIQVWV